MSNREALGAADLTDEEFQQVVARVVGSAPAAVEIIDCRVEAVDYDLPTIFTLARHWVRGRARTPSGVREFSIFVKTICAFHRSPLFALVPGHLRPLVEAMPLPWHAEAAAYRSDLAAHLPDGLRMPQAYAVRDLDESSAAVWLEAIPAVPHDWSTNDLAVAAYRIGRFAASADVAKAARTTRRDVPRHYAGRELRYYIEGRFDHMVVPALQDDELARHPLVAGAFGDLRDRMLAAVDAVPQWLAELEAAPAVTTHGDTAVNNLLRVHGTDDIVLIDFGLLSRMPVGTDLAQLLVGETQLGRRPAALLAADDAAITAAYTAGLHAEGSTIDIDTVRRAHALQMALFSGLSGYPFEYLDAPPTPELMALSLERAAITRYCLDLVDATAAVPVSTGGVHAIG